MPKLNEQKLIEFAKKLEELGIDPVLMMENAYEDETSKAFPYPGCPYFEVTQYGNVVPKKHWGEGTEEEKMYMERMAELCNCWRTQKEAELEVERREIRQILINYGGSPVFDKDNEKMNKDCLNIKLVLDNDYWTEKKSGDSYRICDVQPIEYPMVIAFELVTVPDPSNHVSKLNIEEFLKRFEPSA